MPRGVRTYFVMGVLMAVINVLIFYEIHISGNPSICEEGQFVEGISAFCYLFAAVLTFFRSFHRSGLERKLTWFFSLTCLLFFIRELDLETLNIPHVLIVLGTDSGRNILFITLYLLITVSVLASPANRCALDLATLLKS